MPYPLDRDPLAYQDYLSLVDRMPPSNATEVTPTDVSMVQNMMGGGTLLPAELPDSMPAEASFGTKAVGFAGNVLATPFRLLGAVGGLRDQLLGRKESGDALLHKGVPALAVFAQHNPQILNMLSPDVRALVEAQTSLTPAAVGRTGDPTRRGMTTPWFEENPVYRAVGTLIGQRPRYLSEIEAAGNVALQLKKAEDYDLVRRGKMAAVQAAESQAAWAEPKAQQSYTEGAQKIEKGAYDVIQRPFEEDYNQTKKRYLEAEIDRIEHPASESKPLVTFDQYATLRRAEGQPPTGTPTENQILNRNAAARRRAVEVLLKPPPRTGWFGTNIGGGTDWAAVEQTLRADGLREGIDYQKNDDGSISMLELNPQTQQRLRQLEGGARAKRLPGLRRLQEDYARDFPGGGQDSSMATPGAPPVLGSGEEAFLSQVPSAKRPLARSVLDSYRQGLITRDARNARLRAMGIVD